MKKESILIGCAVIITTIFSSCRSSNIEYAAGAGGTATGVSVDARGDSRTTYDLIPVGNRITYTIDISTPEGQQKLKDISLSNAQRLAETEACRKYNCDRLIDPRFDYFMNEGRILRITVDGRPGNYKTRD